jgi:hypothetical protein
MHASARRASSITSSINRRALGCPYAPNPCMPGRRLLLNREEPGLFGRPVTRERPGRQSIAPRPRREASPKPRAPSRWRGDLDLCRWPRDHRPDCPPRLTPFPGRDGARLVSDPIHGPGLRPSDPVPSRLDLGLSRPDESYPNIVLIDAARSQVYRLLTLEGSDSRCLCTRLSRNSLRIGYTSLFQIAFPALPDDLATHARRWRRSGMPLHRPTHGSVQPASEGRANERGDHTAAAPIRHFKG